MPIPALKVIASRNLRLLFCLRYVLSEGLKPIFFVVFTSNQYIDQHVDASSARTSDLCRVMHDLPSPTSSCSRICLQAPSAKRFQLSGPRSTTPSGSLSISFTISQLNQYYFVFLNCQSQYPVTYSGTLSFVNTNGQQLAYDQIPLSRFAWVCFLCT